jgi:hypothetical protein
LEKLPSKVIIQEKRVKRVERERGERGKWGGGNERNGPGRLLCLYNRVHTYISLCICVAIMRCEIIKKSEEKKKSAEFRLHAR